MIIIIVIIMCSLVIRLWKTAYFNLKSHCLFLSRDQRQLFLVNGLMSSLLSFQMLILLRPVIDITNQNPSCSFFWVTSEPILSMRSFRFCLCFLLYCLCCGPIIVH
jgi:hypothetical protein